MTYYAAAKLAGTKYKIEARRGGPMSEVMAIYDGYYDSRHHVFSLYRKFVGLGAYPTETPAKATVSAYEVLPLKAARERMSGGAGSAPPAEVKTEPATAPLRRRLPDPPGQIKIDFQEDI